MVSTLITAYDQHSLTVAHIKGCMDSNLIPGEIIVVNDGGDDSLKDMIKEIPNKKCPIVYARITKDIRWNQNGARNLAIWLSRGDLLAFEDNDHIPHKDFYKEAVSLVEQGYDRVFVKGRIVVLEEDIINKPVEEWKGIHSRGSAEIITLVKREKILGIKGFDEGFCGFYGWDVPDFVERMDRLGIKKIANGYYYVAPVYSRMNDRTFIGVKNRPKMENVNYHLQMRNRRNNVIQPEKGILNFNYEITYFNAD